MSGLGHLRWTPGTFDAIRTRWRMVFVDRFTSHNARPIAQLEMWKGLVLEADALWFETNVERFKLLEDSRTSDWSHMPM